MVRAGWLRSFLFPAAPLVGPPGSAKPALFLFLLPEPAGAWFYESSFPTSHPFHESIEFPSWSSPPPNPGIRNGSRRLGLRRGNLDGPSRNGAHGRRRGPWRNRPRPHRGGRLSRGWSTRLPAADGGGRVCGPNTRAPLGGFGIEQKNFEGIPCRFEHDPVRENLRKFVSANFISQF